MVARKNTKKSQAKDVEETPKDVEETPKVVEETPAPVENNEESSPVLSVEAQIRSLMATVDEQAKQLKSLKSEFKNILTSYQREVKESKNKKKRMKSKDYVPHGFTKPVHVSKELSKFLGLPEDGVIARPSVTSAISKYIKANGLANPEDGSIFKTDSVLKSLLGEAKHLVKPKKPELGVGFSYMNLQTYLAPHFLKA